MAVWGYALVWFLINDLVKVEVAAYQPELLSLNLADRFGTKSEAEGILLWIPQFAPSRNVSPIVEV